MSVRRIGVLMNGVTGRMGTNQHLVRSVLAIRDQGGIPCGDDTIVPEPMLLGRNEEKLCALSTAHGGLPWSTDVDRSLDDPEYPIYFDAQTTALRVDAVKNAIDHGKHVYCEKPTAETTRAALDLYRYAQSRGVKHGVVQDKLWLPGMVKLRRLIESGFFGRILSVRGEFGYWVFTGEGQSAQRPSWNYRKAEGGGIILDMLSHWRYLIDNLFGNIESLSCLGAIHIPKRWDEDGHAYEVDADDAAYATFITGTGAICHFNASWCVRVRRDDLLTLHVDGTKGSAVAGLRDCLVQSAKDTPRPVWNPGEPKTANYFDGWMPFDPGGTHGNAFKTQWELFLRHVVADEPFRWDLLEGAKGVQLAELAKISWDTRAWVDVHDL